MQKPYFWKEKDRAIRITQELSELQIELSDFTKLKSELEGLKNEKETMELGDEAKASSLHFAKARAFEEK